MKNYLLFIILFMASNLSAQNCDIAEATITNGVRTNTIATSASLDNGRLGLDIIDAHTFAKSLWMGGMDPANNYKIGATSYIDPDQTDFYAGALALPTGLPIFIDHCSDSRKVWKFTESDIMTLRNLHSQGTLTAADLTEDILSYPGRKNAWYEQIMGEELDQEVGPFADRSGDGVYDPLDGDYPIALEESPNFLPVEFSFTVYHDAEFHSHTMGDHMQVEVQQTTYVCFEEGDDLLNHTVYQRLKLINRATTNLYNIKIGLFIDDRLGASATDDFTGCDSALNVVYSYNGQDGIDEMDGTTGVKLHVWLNRDIESSMPVYRPDIGITDLSPEKQTDYYDLLQSQWKDGRHLTEGGIGYDSSSVDLIDFAFPDPPSDPNGWSMATAGSHPGFYDVRTVTAFSRYVLVQNESMILDLADVALIDSSTTGFEKIDDLESIVAQVKDKYNGVATSSIFEAPKDIKKLYLHPNPASSFVTHTLPVASAYTFEIYNMEGKRMDTQVLRSGDTKISLDRISRGFYILKARDEEGNLFAGKFVKI